MFSLLVGEIVIVSLATWTVGGATVLGALAMGARVIAWGRNLAVLRKIATLGLSK